MRCRRVEGCVVPGCWAVALSGRDDFLGCTCTPTMCPEARAEKAHEAAMAEGDRTADEALAEVLVRLRKLEEKVEAMQ